MRTGRLVSRIPPRGPESKVRVRVAVSPEADRGARTEREQKVPQAKPERAEETVVPPALVRVSRAPGPLSLVTVTGFPR